MNSPCLIRKMPPFQRTSDELPALALSMQRRRQLSEDFPFLTVITPNLIPTSLAFFMCESAVATAGCESSGRVGLRTARSSAIVF